MTLSDFAQQHSDVRASGGMETVARRSVTSALPLFMRAHGRAALVTFLVVLMAEGAIGLMLPRRFVATTELWLDRGRNEGGAVAPNTQSARLARNTELRLLASRDLTAQTVEALGLDRVLGLGQPRNGVVLAKSEARREAIRAVQGHLSVGSVGDSYAVRISFLADKPAVAASVANRIADLYVDDRQGKAARSRDRERLARVLADARDNMVRSEAAVEAYRLATSLVGGGRQTGLQAEVVALNAELASVRKSAQAARMGAANVAAAAAPRLRALERRRMQRAIEDGTGSIEIDGQIATRRSQLAQVSAQASQIEARVQLLFRVRESVSKAAADSRRAATELTRLQGLAAAAEARHAQAVVAQSREFAAEARHRSTAYVIARASALGAQREPNPWLLSLICLVGAAAASALSALALDYRYKGFRTSGALEKALGTRVLAMVPDLSGLRRTTAADDRLTVPNYLVRSPNSPFADVFRNLLFALQAGAVQQGPMVIAVSSALPDDGKTTVALCLARSAALERKRVVLVDCDVRRPAASRALFQTLPVGLLEVLKGDPDILNSLQRDPGSDAMVLGIGSTQHDRATSLDLRAFRTLVERLKQHFDIIVCDTPPALALSEARETAALADVVLLVVRHLQTPKGAVMIAQDMLTSAGARIAGAVLTMVRA